MLSNPDYTNPMGSGWQLNVWPTAVVYFYSVHWVEAGKILLSTSCLVAGWNRLDSGRGMKLQEREERGKTGQGGVTGWWICCGGGSDGGGTFLSSIFAASLPPFCYLSKDMH